MAALDIFITVYLGFGSGWFPLTISSEFQGRGLSSDLPFSVHAPAVFMTVSGSVARV